MSEIINDGLSAFHLSTGTHRAYQPAKRNFFEFILENGDGSFDRLLKPGVNAADYGGESAVPSDQYITNSSEIIRLAVNKASIPTFELNEIEIRKGNSSVWYAGTPSFGECTLEVDDMIGLEAKAVLEAWHARCYNVGTDKGGRAINYKRNATLTEYTADHVAVRSWRLIGCWIKSIDEGEYDKTNDDLVRISCSIRYDRAIPSFE